MLAEVHPGVARPWCFAGEKLSGEENMRAAFDPDRTASAPGTVDAHRPILHAAALGGPGKRWETADALFGACFAKEKTRFIYLTQGSPWPILRL